MKKNLYHIDEMRFLIIHLILINHWRINIYMSNNADISLLNFWIDLTSPSLAMISGYLFFYKTQERFDFIKKIKARFHSLVVPYIFWTVAFFFIYFVMKEAYLKIFHTTYWYGPVLSINFTNLASVFVNPPLVNFWYLQNLIFIIPFNYLFYYLLKNKYLYLAFYFFIIAVYSFKLFNIYFDARFLPYYLLGCFLGYNEKNIPKIKLNKIATVILIPALFLLAAETSDIDYSGIWQIVLKVFVVAVFLIFVYNLIDSNMNSSFVVYLHKNKAYSFFLFAINMFLFSLVQRTLIKMGLEPFLANKYFTMIFVIATSLIVIWMALLMARLLKAKSENFYHLITGR